MPEPLIGRRQTTVAPTDIARGGAPPTALAPEPPASEEVHAAERNKLGWGAWLSIAWLVIIVLAAIFASVLPLHSYTNYQANVVNLGPFQSASHPLGGDSNGADMVSLLVFGARSSLIVSVGAIAVGLFVGGLLGLLAGYYRGWVDNILSALFDIGLAFPALVLALALAAFLSGDPSNPSGFHLPNELVIIIALGLVAIPLLARITRASTLTWSRREFITAAKAQGAKTPRILIREILPNVLPATMSLALLSVGVAIVGEGVLSLLGVGVAPPNPSWGNIISLNQSALSTGDPFIVFEPVIAMFLTVFALNFLGDVIRERFDVREGMIS